jgi:hypothetical protein
MLPEGIDDLSHTIIDLAFVRHVHAQAERRACIGKIAGGFGRALGVDVGDGDAAAGFHEALGNAMANPARSTGDESDFAIEGHRTTPFR